VSLTGITQQGVPKIIETTPGTEYTIVQNIFINAKEVELGVALIAVFCEIGIPMNR
jgi:hypothetical protein